MKFFTSLLTCCFIFVSSIFNSLFAQDSDTTRDSLWTTGATVSIIFNQVSLSNWAGGGDDAISLSTFVKAFANYRKDRSAWENYLDMNYGLTKIGEQGLRKSADNFELGSKYGYQLSADSGKLFFSSSMVFRSQFANGFNFPNDSVRISRFMAPGYLLVSTGIDYKPTDYLSIFYSPLTGKFTFVLDDALSSTGEFGVDPGSKARSELGSFFKLLFNKEVFTNVTFQTKLDLFSNYFENPGDIDINWETGLVMKVNEFLTTNIFTHLIYDKDILFDVIENEEVVRQESKVQFKEVFGIGLTFSF